MGYKALAPVDRFMERRRIPVIVGTGLVVAAGLPLLYWLQFDFNPLNLRSPKVESVATFLDLRSDPAIGASSIYVLAPNKEAADADMAKLRKLPEVTSVKTIESFIPDDQQPKLAAIRQLGTVLDPVLRPDPNKKPPTDADNVAALKAAVDGLKQAAGTQTGRGATAAKRLADDLAKLADGDEALRKRAHAATDPAARHRARRAAELSAGAAGDARNPAGRDRARMGHAGRALQGRNPAEGRSERQRDVAPIRARGAGRRAERHRRADLDPRIRPHRDPGVLRSRLLGARLDHHPALDRAAPVRRRPAHPHSAAHGGRS